MDHTIGNEYLDLTVSDHGAEIRSLIRKADGLELMWQADPAYWGRTSPILFPYVGNCYGQKMRYEGRVYNMGKHGFARNKDFELIEETDEKLSFRLIQDDETLANYPFDFTLTISYRLTGKTVEVNWQVENTNDHDMYFHIGGHPAFNCDLDTWTLRLSREGKALSAVTSGKVSDDGSGCMSGEEYTLSLDNGILHMSDELFKDDALVIEKSQADAVTLTDPEGADVVTVEFDAPVFGVWSPAELHAPFVCIEPWYGRCDRVGYAGELRDREYTNSVAAGDRFKASYRVRV